MTDVQEHRPLSTKLVRTAIAGGLTTAIEILVFKFLIMTLPLPQAIAPIVANPVAFSLSAIINYLFCRLWIFDKRGSALHREITHFFVIALIGLGAQTVIFTVVFRIISHPIVSLLVAMGLVFFVNFYLKQRLFSDGERKKNIAQLRMLCQKLPFHSQIHLLVRWQSCPFEAANDFVPESGKLLEIGCGRGLFSTWAAVTHPQLEVMGTDIDERKIADAKIIAKNWHRDQKISFAQSKPVSDVPAGPWQAIAIVDVLYLMQKDKQFELLKQCAKQLAPRGVLIIKQMNTHPHWKASWGKFQEYISVRILGLTRGEQEFTFLSPQVIADCLKQLGLETTIRPVDKGYLHPHVVIVGSRG